MYRKSNKVLDSLPSSILLLHVRGIHINCARCLSLRIIYGWGVGALMGHRGQTEECLCGGSQNTDDTQSSAQSVRYECRSIFQYEGKDVTLQVTCIHCKVEGDDNKWTPASQSERLSPTLA